MAAVKRIVQMGVGALAAWVAVFVFATAEVIRAVVVARYTKAECSITEAHVVEYGRIFYAVRVTVSAPVLEKSAVRTRLDTLSTDLDVTQARANADAARGSVTCFQDRNDPNAFVVARVHPFSAAFSLVLLAALTVRMLRKQRRASRGASEQPPEPMYQDASDEPWALRGPDVIPATRAALLGLGYRSFGVLARRANGLFVEEVFAKEEITAMFPGTYPLFGSNLSRAGDASPPQRRSRQLHVG